MSNIGIKLWSTSYFYINPALELFRKGLFDYIELYVVPGSLEKSLYRWKEMDIPYILHSPHSYSAFNLSIKEFEQNNLFLLAEVELFRKALNPRWIIFHPGIEGTIDETVRQINRFKKDYPELFDLAIFENKPKIGLNGEYCLGAAPKDIRRLIQKTGLGFCLDIGHAICYAAWSKVGWEEVIDSFMKLNPKVFHLSDGDINSKTDNHFNFGEGNYNLCRIIKRLPANAYVSIETKKNSQFNLNDFERDIIYFNEYMG